MSNRERHTQSRPNYFIVLATRATTLTMLVMLGAVAPIRLFAQTPNVSSPSSANTRPTFDVVSIKVNKSGDRRVMFRPQPGGRFDGPNMTLGMLLNLAYQLKPHQLVGGPGWMDSEHFDIEAKAEGNPPMDQMRLMLQSLLADRFKLMVHHEMRQLPVYALVLAKPGKTGTRLAIHSGDTRCADISNGPPPPPNPAAGLPPTPCGGFLMGNGHMAAQKVTMDGLARSLGNFVDRIVVDQTGLDGVYDVDFDFTPLQSPPGFQPGPTVAASDPSEPPSIFTALQEQLGLKLESQTAPVDVLVIDHVEQPSEN